MDKKREIMEKNNKIGNNNKNHPSCKRSHRYFSVFTVIEKEIHVFRVVVLVSILIFKRSLKNKINF